MGKSYVGDIGTRIRIDLNTSLVDATTETFWIVWSNNERGCISRNDGADLSGKLHRYNGTDLYHIECHPRNYPAQSILPARH